MIKFANGAHGIPESVASAASNVYRAERLFALEQIGSTAAWHKSDTAGTVIRRQSVGFEPKFGWYRGLLCASS